MSLDINQGNLYLLLPSKVAWLTDMLTEDKGIGIVDAIREITAVERAIRRVTIYNLRRPHHGRK